MENTEKMTPREWVENIWYHYKWLIIFGGMFVLFVVVSIGQMFSHDDPDVDILHVGPMYISGETADLIEETLAKMSDDCTDDDEINVSILDITINKVGSENSDPLYFDHNNEGYKRFQTEIRAGDAVIYLLEEPYFNICVEEGLLTPFDEIIDDAYMPENVISGCGVKISDLDAYELPGLSTVSDTLVLCLRRSPSKDQIDYGRSQEVWDNNRKTFVNVIKYQSEKQD